MKQGEGKTVLPVEAVLDELTAVLQKSNAVLIAPPGAGKTTRVPLALLSTATKERRILVLEPRRIAAQSTAEYMAGLLGESVGQTVGYRMRRASKTSTKTRLLVITEGLLIPMLQADPALSEWDIVIFDEFHERSLQADLGLALCLESQAILRPDLKLLVMSATLIAQPVASLLGSCPVVISEGRSFPVTTIYLDRPTENWLQALCVVTRQALAEETGDLLVFLPGRKEIRQAAALIRASEDTFVVLELHGSLSQTEQAAILRPQSKRRIILATAIAETSLTVEGVRIVIDSGLMRVPRFSPRRALTYLDTIPVSLASADQRRGRAGRTEPGICYRLWTQTQEQHFALQGKPEILEADLAFLVLELSLWGTKDAYSLAWLDAPPSAALAQGRDLLQLLGAVDETGTVTEHGRAMAAAGIHPRLSHMILAAASWQLGREACYLAAFLQARQQKRTSREADIRVLLEELFQANQQAELRLLAREAEYLQKVFQLVGPVRPQKLVAAAGLLLAWAYPDRIAQQRSNGRYLLRQGSGATWRHGASNGAIADSAYLAIAELELQGADSSILLAAPLSEAELEQCCSEAIETTEKVLWNKAAKVLQARRQRRLGALVLQEQVAPLPANEVLLPLLVELLQQGELLLPWTKAAQRFCQRMEFMHYYSPQDWPDYSEQALLATVETWLLPYCGTIRGQADLDQIQLLPLLEGLLSWPQRQLLETYAPEQFLVPSGRKVVIHYDDPACPRLAVKLQELFGLTDTPRLLGGKVPLTFHLLSPAQRPVQVTSDLANFWRNTYFSVKKDLQGRYPKHYWPEDPLQAIATQFVRPKLQ